MHTLKQLQSGALKGESKITLSCNLTHFPNQLYTLADTLEVLDLSGNKLSSLPKEIHHFKKLKIIFLSDNLFTHFPEELQLCPNLEMIGFKSNKIATIAENAIPVNTRWLILTNNCIQQLPASIGTCTRLQKLMLAGNQLSSLPPQLAACKNLELLRISANAITQLPLWLFTLPRLSWLAYAGNPCSKVALPPTPPHTILWQQLIIEKQLGEGASGHILKATTNNTPVAVKVFKGEVTSDGLPHDELLASIASHTHPNIIKVIAQIKNHTENKAGLVLELVAGEYKNLGNPPNFETCTRDTFEPSLTFSVPETLKIISALASAMVHLHQKGIMHGDLYAHNILIDTTANPLLGDFGAATLYNTTDETTLYLQKTDVSAFGCLLEDLLMLTKPEHRFNNILSELLQLKNKCRNTVILERPDFKTIHHYLTNLN